MNFANKQTVTKTLNKIDQYEWVILNSEFAEIKNKKYPYTNRKGQTVLQHRRQKVPVKFLYGLDIGIVDKRLFPINYLKKIGIKNYINLSDNSKEL